MPSIVEDPNRQVIPLWRSFETTVLRRELAPISKAPDHKFANEMLTELLLDWKERQTISVAADFVSVALTLGLFEVAVDAADFILSQGTATAAAKNVAIQYLAKGEPKIVEHEQTPVSLTERLSFGVRETRKSLIEYPNNPILWMELSRLHTSLGNQEKAAKAMRAALMLAPNNRFILRASSRLLLHLGKKGEAHRLLARAPSLKVDPWVLAAEIATAAAIGKTSRFINFGWRLLEVKKHAPNHLSELASALATIEFLSGNLKNGKRLIGFSLEDAADNSIAQAAWLGRKVNGLSVIPQTSTNSFEANAWFAYQNSKWDVALLQSRFWQFDQPFSSRPAVFGSALASTAVEDFGLALDFVRQGLLSNPDDFSLRNNLAFVHALRGDVVEAQKALQSISSGQLNSIDRVVFDATSGLVAYRSGDFEKGRFLYRSAIESGRKLKDKREHIARIYFAFEELRIGSADAEVLRRGAIEEAKILVDPHYTALVKRLTEWKPSKTSALPVTPLSQK